MWNFYSTNNQWADGEINGFKWSLETGSNIYSTIGPNGGAWSLGWEIGRAVTSTDLYQNAKYQFWCKCEEWLIGSPSQSNEYMWNYFYENYK